MPLCAFDVGPHNLQWLLMSAFLACRDRGITKLLQIDVSTSSSGALLVTLSDQGAGFAPYRLDNNTPLTLHLR
jgi:hypothetical protein